MPEPNPVAEVLRAFIDELYTVDAADTPAALRAAWRGFDALAEAGDLLAESHVDYGVLQRHARPSLSRADRALRRAPSLPTDVKPLTLNLAGERVRPAADHVAYGIHQDVLDIAYGLNILLPAAAGYARDRADRRACREAARLAHQLVNCYEGRLNLFTTSHAHPAPA